MFDELAITLLWIHSFDQIHLITVLGPPSWRTEKIKGIGSKEWNDGNQRSLLKLADDLAAVAC